MPKAELAFCATESVAISLFARGCRGGGAAYCDGPKTDDEHCAALLFAVAAFAGLSCGGGAVCCDGPKTDDAHCAALEFGLPRRGSELAAGGGTSYFRGVPKTLEAFCSALVVAIFGASRAVAGRRS